MDTVDQIEMPKWTDNRVVLIGDAAHCASIVEGQGASLAITGAYVLAQELARSSSVPRALQLYEHRMRPSVHRRQRAGRRLSRWFVPGNHWSLELRNHALRWSLSPAATWWARRRLMTDDPLEGRG